MTAAKPPVPIFRSFNEAATKSFYIDFLGFDLAFEHRFEPGFPLYMGVQMGDCELHLSEHYGDASPGSSVRIEIPDVHAYCQALNDKKTHHARPGVQTQDWGFHDMTINDPNGNTLIFCTPVEN